MTGFEDMRLEIITLLVCGFKKQLHPRILLIWRVRLIKANKM